MHHIQHDYDSLEESQFPAFPVVFQQEIHTNDLPQTKALKGPFKMPEQEIKQLLALLEITHDTSYPNLFKECWENATYSVQNFFSLYRPLNAEFIEVMKKHLNQLQIVRVSSHKIYIGQFSEGSCQGMGVLIFKNGNLYEGHFLQNKRHGKGIYVECGFGYFDGVFINDVKSEEGLEIIYKKSGYRGGFLNGLRHEKGTYVERQQSMVYNGQWKLGIIHGKGTLKTHSSVYYGQFANSLKHGSGEERFINGDAFKGQFQNNRFDGHGSYTWNHAEAVYEGGFKNGLRHGKGKWFAGETKYNGAYIEGLKEGYGELYFPSGNFYKGNFVEDKREGYGEMFWTDGSFYKGDWKEGIQNGKGQIYLTGGQIISGIFQNSILIQMMPTIYEKQMEISSMGIHDLFGSKQKLEEPQKTKTRVFSQSKQSLKKKKLAKIDETTRKNHLKSHYVSSNHNNNSGAHNNSKTNPIKDRIYFKSPERSENASKEKDGGRECKCMRRLQNFRLKQRIKTKMNESHVNQEHSHSNHKDHILND